MKQVLFVAVGGAFGSSLRYLTGLIYLKFIPQFQFWSTFTVNILGAFFMGLAFAYVDALNLGNNYFKYFVMIGILGGFTTFSAFSLEMMQLIKNQNFGFATMYFISMNLITIGATFLGFYVFKLFVENN